jgi:hypothetical protein
VRLVWRIVDPHRHRPGLEAGYQLRVDLREQLRPAQPQRGRPHHGAGCLVEPDPQGELLTVDRGQDRLEDHLEAVNHVAQLVGSQAPSGEWLIEVEYGACVARCVGQGGHQHVQ